MKPQIISYDRPLAPILKRLRKDAAYRDLSCVLIIPALQSIPTRVVASWMSLFPPPNQKIARLFAQGMEVGEAYSRTLEAVLQHPELSKFRFVVTLEHDNAPPCDGLVRLLASLHEHQEFAAMSGLYFTKGHGGVAQIWGNPNEHPINFKPQLPRLDGGIVECHGLGMGFTAFRMDLFKNKKLRRPWFKTVASAREGVGTQDLYAFSDFRKHGYRCAVDCSIRVGHFDAASETMW